MTTSKAMKQHQEHTQEAREPEFHWFQYLPHAMTKAKVTLVQSESHDAADLEAFLDQHKYRWLPGSRPGIDVYKSSEAASRYLVVIDLKPRYVFVVGGLDSLDYCKAFLEWHSDIVALLPEYWLPEPTPAPDNRYIGNPILRLPVPY